MAISKTASGPRTSILSSAHVVDGGGLRLPILKFVAWHWTVTDFRVSSLSKSTLPRRTEFLVMHASGACVLIPS
jgi:hypothetical protein